MRDTRTCGLRFTTLVTILGVFLWMALDNRPARAQDALRGVRNLLVLDAAGKLIGPVLDIRTIGGVRDGGVSVVVSTASTWFILQFNCYRDAAGAVDCSTVSGSDYFLLFESADCSGRSYFLNLSAPSFGIATPDPTLPRALITPPGLTVYVIDPNGAPTPITAQSYQFGESHAGICTTGANIVDAAAIPAIAIMDISTEFTLPFRVVPSRP